MNNLFKRSVASLALVGAMTGSLFGGNAAYIDVRVNYLSGTGKAVLGYSGTAGKDKVELYIRVLDKDGEFADKDNTGAALIKMGITRSGNDVDNYSADGVTGTITSNVITRGVTSTTADSGKAIADKNAARYTLDYTDHDTASLIDSLKITAGNLGKNIKINLMAVDAKGLIVRITTKDILSSTGGILNEQFSNIAVSGSNNLNVQATDLPQAIVGQKVPLMIYASNAAVTKKGPNGPSGGRYTSSEAFDGKTIVVIAVGDYNVSGKTDTYISQTELIMNKGIAKGNIVINYGLPEKNATSGVIGNTNFGTANVGGLGVAFIAYMKDKPSVSNNGAISFSNGVLRTGEDRDTNLKIDGNDSDTDSLKVKSGSIVGFKVGMFNPNGTRNMASTYFTDTSNVFIANSNGLTNNTPGDIDENISIIAIDKFGNPGTIATPFTTSTPGPTSATVSGESATYVSGNATVQAGLTGTYFDINGSDANLTTHATTGITSAYVIIVDKSGLSADQEAVKKTVNIFFRNGELEGTTPAKFTVTTLDVIGETPEAIKGPLRGKIDIDITENSKIFTEHATESDKSDMKVYMKVANVSDNNVTLTIKTLDEEGEIDNSFDFNVSNSTAFISNKIRGYQVEVNNSAKVIDVAGLGTITFSDINSTTKLVDDYSSSLGTTTVLTLKGRANANIKVFPTDSNLSHRKFVDAYVKTTISTKGAEDFVQSTSEAGIPGKVIIDFDFSGDFISQNIGNTKATISFLSGDAGNKSMTSGVLVGLVGEEFSSVSTLDRPANTRTITAKIPSSGRLSVVLYNDVATNNNPGNIASANTLYDIGNITVNNFSVLPTSRRGNELTKAIDVDVVAGDKNVTITMAAGGKKTATAVAINGIGTNGNGEGGSTDRSLSLPKAGGNALLDGFTAGTTSEVKTDSDVKVLTNIYYTLFDGPTNLKVEDAYGNSVNMESTALADNYKLTSSDEKCAIVKMNDGSTLEPATIFFKDCAAGKEISVTITAKGSLEESKAFNKLTFTNIAKSSENTKFNVSLNVGSENYNVANNDVVVKIVGDGNTKSGSTNIVVTSDNKDAKITLRPVKLLNGNEFTSLVDDGKITTLSVSKSGNYYVIRSDLKGKVTVKVDSIIPKAEAKSKKDTPISGTLSFDVTLVDLVAPTAKVKATSSGFILTITDVSLNEVATTAEVYKDGVLLKALTGSKGVYTAKVPQGLYSVKVHAEDISGNTLNKSYPILVGQAGTSVTIESSLIAKGTYEIAGTFTSHDFADKNAAFDWVYTDNKGVSYQLLGKTPTATDLFGWKEVDLKPTSKDWSMIELTGDNKGPLGWVLVDNDTKAAFKLQGAKADNTFEFSSALYINVTIDGSNVKFTKK